MSDILFQACMNKDLANINLLTILEDNWDTVAQYRDPASNLTLFHAACGAGALKLCINLHKHGADINDTQNPQKVSPLIFTIQGLSDLYQQISEAHQNKKKPPLLSSHHIEVIGWLLSTSKKSVLPPVKIFAENIATNAWAQAILFFHHACIIENRIFLNEEKNPTWRIEVQNIKVEHAQMIMRQFLQYLLTHQNASFAFIDPHDSLKHILSLSNLTHYEGTVVTNGPTIKKIRPIYQQVHTQHLKSLLQKTYCEQFFMLMTTCPPPAENTSSLAPILKFLKAPRPYPAELTRALNFFKIAAQLPPELKYYLAGTLSRYVPLPVLEVDYSEYHAAAEAYFLEILHYHNVSQHNRGRFTTLFDQMKKNQPTFSNKEWDKLTEKNEAPKVPEPDNKDLDEIDKALLEFSKAVQPKEKSSKCSLM